MFKRAFDLTFATLGLVILSPVLLLVAVSIFFNIGSPLLFQQIRPGRNAKPFTMYKFRTMRSAFDENGTPLPDKERMTAIGKKIRTTSLDELPELWNVIKGEMSLVGPRPLLLEYLPLYSKVQYRRHEVRPGITGWAQVNGRNAISWEEKFNLDVWYVENRSICLDIKIILITIVKVFKREGISQANEITIKKFEGNIE